MTTPSSPGPQGLVSGVAGATPPPNLEVEKTAVKKNVHKSPCGDKGHTKSSQSPNLPYLLGNVSVIVVPSSALDATASSPLCARTIAAVIASPSPAPPVAR